MRETLPRFLRRFLPHTDFLHRRRRREAGLSLLPVSGTARPCFAVLTVLALPMQLDGVSGRLDGRGDAGGCGPGGGCRLLVAGEAAGEDGGADSTLDSWLVVREKPPADSRQVDTVATHTTVLPKSGEAATDWRLMPFVAARTSGGMPGQPIPLSVAVTSPYGQPNPQHEAITYVLIGNLPQGASLSRGQRTSDGAWKVQLEELSDLALIVPSETTAPLTLHIAAVTDHGGGVVARQAVTLAVPVSETVVADNSAADNFAAEPPEPAHGGSSQGSSTEVMEAAAKPDMAEPAVSGSSSPPAPQEPQTQEPQQSEPALAEAPPAEAPAAVQTIASPPPPPEPPAAPTPTAVALAAVPAAASAPPTPPRTEKREEAVHRPAKLPSGIPEAMLMKRGDDLFAQGDLAGARLYYEMVAETGNAKAAFALGRTHDPLVHERLHVRGLPPDPERAATWYRRAVAAGSGDAERQLKKLTDWLAGKSR